ncbi:unnamed protein product [Camellia sinensis]
MLGNPQLQNHATNDASDSTVDATVLERRKSVLQKEQGMAFAHVVAAVFYIDHMAPLVLFAECLGASRLMDACSWFIDLWKGKHETGQWLEIEAAEAMSNRSDFSAMNASGIMLSSMANKQNESHGDLASEDNGKAAIDASAGDKTVTDANEERAIVLYKPDSHPPEANGSIAQEGNSKVQLLKVLETRRSVLQKEQGMAFARAVAAGFDIDHMAPLVSFAECFGASRLMDACSRFVDLWKGKHETGQWLEIEAAEAMSNRSDFSAMNASGIMLSSMANKQNESHGDLASEDNGKAAIDASAGDKTVTDANEERAIVLYKPDSHPPEANGSIAQDGNSKYILVLRTRRSVLQKEQGMAFARAVAAGFDIDHMAPLVSFAECFGASRLMDACSRFVDLWKGKHETGQWLEIEAAEAMSNRSDFSAMNASGIMLSSMANKQNESHGDLALEDNGKAAIDASAGDKTVTVANEERAIVLYKPDSHPPEANGSIAQEGNSKYILVLRVQLLKVLETRRSVLQKEQGMAFARAVAAGFDIDHMAPLVSFAVVGRDSPEGQDGRITEFHKASGNVARMLRASNDEGLISRGEGHYGDGIGSTDDQMDIQFTETNGRKVLYRNNAIDDFMIVGRENQSHFLSSSDPLVVNGFTRATNNLDGSSPQDMIDESFIVPFRSMSLDHVGTNVRTAIDMDSELPSTMQRSEYSSNRTGNQINYEPDDLSFMPECGTEKMTTGYDPALDYEMQAHVEDAGSLDNRNKEVEVDVKQGSKKSDKDRKSKVAPDALDKKTVGPIRKGKTSKMRPLEDARARAEKLRAFKADIQKMKKNKEEEYRKRLETLKMEREKRIAARTAQLASSQKTRKQLPTKLALSSVKGTNDDQHKPVIDKTVFIA